jgi:hypothetical protein
MTAANSARQASAACPALRDARLSRSIPARAERPAADASGRRQHSKRRLTSGSRRQEDWCHGNSANHNAVEAMDALSLAEREADSAVIIVCEDSERSGAVACE